MSKHGKLQNPSSSTSPLDFLPEIIASLLIVALPFFPDEKLTRLKMLSFELGILSLLAVSGAAAFLKGDFMQRLRSDRPLMSAVLIWFAVQCGLAFFSTESTLAHTELRRIVLGAAAFFAFYLAALSGERLNRFLLTWTIGGGVMSLYGILQASGGIGFIQVPQMDRVMGTFGNPIFFAAYLVPTIFITLRQLFASKGKDALQFGVLICLLLEIAALYHTQTRAAWLAAAAGLTFYLLMRFPSRQARLTLAGLFIVGAGVFFVKTQKVWSRDQGHALIWRDTLRMWKDHPISGVGLGAFHTNFPSYAQEDLVNKWPKGQFIVNYAHSEYIQQLAEGGLVGLGSFLAVIGVFFWSVLKKTGSPNDYLLPLAALGLLIQNFFSVDMRFGITFGMLFMLMGINSSPLMGEGRERVANPPLPSPPPLGGREYRWLLAFIWLGVLGGALLPPLLQPYRAQKESAATPDFFDVRVLDPLKSIQELEAMAQKFPEEPAVLEKLAFVYAKEMRTPDGKTNSEMVNKSIEAYQRVIALDPQRVSATNNLANIYYTVGQTDQAIELWKKTVEIQPEFLDAHLNLGKTLYVRGDLKEAASHFEKVLKIDPKNAEAIVYMKRMVE